MYKTLVTLTACIAMSFGAALLEPLAGKLSRAEILAATTKEDWRALDPVQPPYIELERGRVAVALSSIFAQTHVANIKKLACPAFDAFVESRRDRPEAFFFFRSDYADIRQLPVPVREIGAQ